MTYGEKYLLATHGSTNRRARRAEKVEKRKEAARERRRQILRENQAAARARKASDAFFSVDHPGEPLQLPKMEPGWFRTMLERALFDLEEPKR